MVVAAGLGLLIGAVIGGLGGGGGVLTVPLLVYVLGQDAQDATTGSVVIVGVSAAVGVLSRCRAGLVRWRTGAALGAVGIPAAALGTALNQRVAEPVLLLAFAVLTAVAALALLRGGDDPEPAAPSGGVVVSTRTSVARVVGCGVVIGFLTGFLGVGGGFVLVPALVIVLRMPMVPAVGTSLLVITINSAAAFAVRAGSVAGLDWGVLVPFTVAAVVAGFAGRRLADRCPTPTLTRAFAAMLLLVGLFVGVESLIALT